MTGPSARDKDKACARAENEIYEIAARLYAAGVGIYLIAGVMHRAWERAVGESAVLDGSEPEPEPAPLDIW